MGKNKLNSEAHYKNIINKQKSIIKKLSKQKGRASKIEDRYYDIEEKQAEFLLNEYKQEDKNIKKTNTCPKCSNSLEIIEGTKIKVFVCENCNYRCSVRV